MSVMIEHEKKYRVTLHHQIVDDLNKLGFSEAGGITQKDIYFTRADVDFMETKECLRIREEDGLCELTYKPPTTKEMEASGSIWKKETNIELPEGAALLAEEFLESIGCEKLCVVDKRRTSFKRENVTVALDSIAGVGDFVEIEILADDHVKSAIAEIESVASDLGIDVSSTVNAPYRDLVMDAQS